MTTADHSKFIEQFTFLRGSLFLAFDSFIYGQGIQMLGRRSGNWEAVKVGTVYALMLGEGDVNLTNDGRVHMVVPMSGNEVDTDATTASVAFTLLVVNWFWGMHHESLSDAENEAFSAYYEALRHGMWEDNPTVKLNNRDMFTLKD